MTEILDTTTFTKRLIKINSSLEQEKLNSAGRYNIQETKITIASYCVGQNFYLFANQMTILVEKNL